MHRAQPLETPTCTRLETTPLTTIWVPVYSYFTFHLSQPLDNHLAPHDTPGNNHLLSQTVRNDLTPCNKTLSGYNGTLMFKRLRRVRLALRKRVIVSLVISLGTGVLIGVLYNQPTAPQGPMIYYADMVFTVDEPEPLIKLSGAYNQGSAYSPISVVE